MPGPSYRYSKRKKRVKRVDKTPRARRGRRQGARATRQAARETRRRGRRSAAPTSLRAERGGRDVRAASKQASRIRQGKRSIKTRPPRVYGRTPKIRRQIRSEVTRAPKLFGTRKGPLGAPKLKLSRKAQSQLPYGQRITLPSGRKVSTDTILNSGRGVSTLTALEIASLGLPGIGLVTTSGRVIGGQIVKQIAKEVAEGGAKQIVKGGAKRAVARGTHKAAVEESKKKGHTSLNALQRAERAEGRIKAANRPPREAPRPNIPRRPSARRRTNAPQREPARPGGSRASGAPHRGRQSINRRQARAEREARIDKLMKSKRPGDIARRISARRVARRSTRRGPIRRITKRGPKGAAARSAPVGAGGGAYAVASAPGPATSTGGTEEAQRLATAPYQLGRAAVEHPGQFGRASARTLRDSFFGIPAAVKQMVTDPKGAADQIIADYKHRYGPLLEGQEEEFRKRALEVGFTPFAFDALIAAPPAGRIAGAAARSGALGRRAASFATRGRPRLRTAPEKSRGQRVSKNLGAVAAQRGLDRVRGRTTRRRAERKNREGEPTGDALAREALDRGEVVPLRQKKALKRIYGEGKGRAYHSMLGEQREVVTKGVLAAAKRELNRNERRGVKEAVALGARTPAAGRRAALQRIADIEEFRRQNPGVKYPKHDDEIPRLRYIAENAEKVFTPRLAAFADRVGDIGRYAADLDPSLSPETAALARQAAQAQHLGLERRVVPEGEAEISVAVTPFREGAHLSDNFHDSGTFRKWQEVVPRRAGDYGLKAEIRVAGGRWPGGAEPSSTIRIAGAADLDLVDGYVADLGKLGRQQAVVRFAPDPNAPDEAYVLDVSGLPEAQVAKAIDESNLPGASHELNEGRLVVMGEGQSLRAATDDLAHALDRDAVKVPGSFRIMEAGDYEQAIQKARARYAAHGGGDTAGPRGLRGSGRHASVKEEAASFLARIDAEAQQQGLARGAYFPSQIRRDRPDFSAQATGGTRAVAGVKRRQGKLFALGIEDPRVHTLAQGYYRNIKRAFNWNLVADTFDVGTFAWSRNRSLADLLIEIRARGLDENSVRLWNPDRFRRARDEAEFTDLDVEYSIGELEGFGSEAIRDGLEGAAPTVAQLRRELELSTSPSDFSRTRGWSLVPAALYDEVFASTRTNLLARTLGILTQKQSRFLLGALNIPWLQFQIISNGALAGLAGTGPLDLLKAQVWWRGLSRAEKKATEPYIGLGHFQTDIRQTKLGAASTNRVVNAWRGLKETVGGKLIWPGRRVTAQVRDLNPLDALFRVDNAQNNFFRRGVLYSQVKRDAYRRMGANTSRLGALQNRLMHTFDLGPDEQMRALLRDKNVLEGHAHTVNDWLGDYMTFTHAERTWLKSNVMFYAFLRFSVRLAFYTMPVKHPVITGILGNMARMEADEVRELLGGDELPYALGRIYFDNGKMVVDLSRANPVLNAISQGLFTGGLEGKLSGMTGLLPPLYGALISQLAQKEMFTGKPWLVQGETQTRRYLGVGAEERARIFSRQFLQMFYPYRLAEDIVYRGRPVGADSLAFDARYTDYKDEEIRRDINRASKQLPGAGGTALEQTFPAFIPRRSRDKEIAESLRERIEEEKQSLGITKSRSSSGSNPWTSSGSGSNPWMSGGSSNPWTK